MIGIRDQGFGAREEKARWFVVRGSWLVKSRHNSAFACSSSPAPSPEPLAPVPATNHQPPTTNYLRRAFTLVEMLVVITIIAVLAALASVAVVRALETAKQTRIKVEVDGLDAAFKSYKEKYGAYPPCDLTFSGGNPKPQLIQHIARIFPRYVMSNNSGPYAKLAADLTAAGIDTTFFRPDQALVFWLQGFSPDPMNPFMTPTGYRIVNGTPDTSVQVKITPLFSFDPSRLYQVVTNNSSTPPVISPTYQATYNISPAPIPSYFPQGPVPPSSTAAPYLYWDAGTTTTNTSGGTTTVTSNYGVFSYSSSPSVATVTLPVVFNYQNTSGTPQTWSVYPNAGFAIPYWQDANASAAPDSTENWVNPDSFQIISAGLDGIYGNGSITGVSPGNLVRLYPTGTGYDLSNNLADDDNITNFNAKARLSDAKP